MNGTVFQLVRIIVVLALVCTAAAMATPRGRLPLALRGLQRILRRDAAEGSDSGGREAGDAKEENVSIARRLLAFLLLLAALALACL